MASHPAKAMKAYEKAHAWRELFTVAKEQKLEDQAIASMVERVTGKLACARVCAIELIPQIIYPAGERTWTPLRCSWTTRMMSIAQ